ncbi:FHA domain-containing protein [Thiohalophilus sp.]|uniref:FHA domain-containing protein n=1 Tax=Thiohalophilus sp. TaxID=3028392 RepID=UPI002ACED927|nr:FHA domain-containing protein [Thiohalophilus sp.]MDZ7661139.1 FHA domain-containing protein [Thiohalophilus sp.]
MARISVLYNSEEINVFEVFAGTLTIGRAGDNTVRLNDKTVSKHHAQIVTYFSATHIEDLGSTNGTYVNGKRVNMHVLQAGDTLSIGKYQLKVAADTVVSSADTHASASQGKATLLPSQNN